MVAANRFWKMGWPKKGAIVGGIGLVTLLAIVGAVAASGGGQNSKNEEPSAVEQAKPANTATATPGVPTPMATPVPTVIAAAPPAVLPP